LEQKQFKCRLCGKVFNSFEERDQHNHQAHPEMFSGAAEAGGKKKDEP
jgi:hypothetical protein